PHARRPEGPGRLPDPTLEYGCPRLDRPGTSGRGHRDAAADPGGDASFGARIARARHAHLLVAHRLGHDPLPGAPRRGPTRTALTRTPLHPHFERAERLPTLGEFLLQPLPMQLQDHVDDRWVVGGQDPPDLIGRHLAPAEHIFNA